MHERFKPQILAAWGMAALLAAACGNNADRSAATDESRPGAGSPNASMSGKEARPIDVTGCMQKSGMSYVLTESSSAGSAGAPRGSTGGGAVEREQMQSAQHSYRVTAADDKVDLAALVGKQVKVSGKVTDQSDLTARDENKTSSVGTSGSQEKGTAGSQEKGAAGSQAKGTAGSQEKAGDVDTGDLAKIEATSIEKVADACGTGSERGSATKK
jgi:hypothetical protein